MKEEEEEEEEGKWKIQCNEEKKVKKGEREENWYDRECKRTKKELKERKMRKISAREKCGEKRKEYKEIIKMKKYIMINVINK